jgi:DNA modification methylase
MKPISLIEQALHNSSQAGDLILDLFGGSGSGSTLIAAEKTGRRGGLMELDPHYCDVIIQRFQDFTHQKATRIGTSLTFDEAVATSASALSHPLAPADLSR